MTSSIRIEEAIRGLSTPFQKLLSQAALVLMGAGVYALAAQISIPLPFTPVPITGQTFALFLVSGVLGLRLSTSAAITYLIMGFMGLPVFAGGLGGFLPSAMSFGYLWGLVLSSAIMGWFASRGHHHQLRGLLISLVLGNIALYVPGIFWMGVLAGFDKPLLAWGLYPFILGDTIKIVLALGLIGSVRGLLYTKDQ